MLWSFQGKHAAPTAISASTVNKVVSLTTIPSRWLTYQSRPWNIVNIISGNRYECLFKRLFRIITQNWWWPMYTESLTGGFPAKRTSNAVSVSLLWLHRVCAACVSRSCVEGGDAVCSGRGALHYQCMGRGPDHRSAIRHRRQTDLCRLRRGQDLQCRNWWVLSLTRLKWHY